MKIETATVHAGRPPRERWNPPTETVRRGETIDDNLFTTVDVSIRAKQFVLSYETRSELLIRARRGRSSLRIRKREKFFFICEFEIRVSNSPIQNLGRRSVEEFLTLVEFSVVAAIFSITFVPDESKM